MTKHEIIIARIQTLRGDLRQALEESKDFLKNDNREVEIATARYDYYLKGLEANLGFNQVCKLVKMAKEVE